MKTAIRLSETQNFFFSKNISAAAVDARNWTHRRSVAMSPVPNEQSIKNVRRWDCCTPLAMASMMAP
jgi:hypothetical protein